MAVTTAQGVYQGGGTYVEPKRPPSSTPALILWDCVWSSLRSRWLALHKRKVSPRWKHLKVQTYADGMQHTWT